LVDWLSQLITNHLYARMIYIIYLLFCLLKIIDYDLPNLKITCYSAIRSIINGLTRATFPMRLVEEAL
jgi:hypothetical protein